MGVPPPPRCFKEGAGGKEEESAVIFWVVARHTPKEDRRREGGGEGERVCVGRALRVEKKSDLAGFVVNILGKKSIPKAGFKS